MTRNIDKKVAPLLKLIQNKNDHKMMDQIVSSLEVYERKFKDVLENQKYLKEAIECNSDNVAIIDRNQKVLIGELEVALENLQCAKNELDFVKTTLVKTKEELKSTKKMLFEMTELVTNDSLRRESEAKSVVMWNLDEGSLNRSAFRDMENHDAIKLFALNTVKNYFPEVYTPGLKAKRLPNAKCSQNKLRLLVSFTTVHEKQMFLTRCYEMGFKTVHGGKTLLQRLVAKKAKSIAKNLNDLPQTKGSIFTASSNGVITEKSKNIYRMESSYKLTKIVEKPLTYLTSIIDNTVPPDKPSPNVDDSQRSLADAILYWYWSSDDSTTKASTSRRNHNTNPQ